MQEFQGRYRPPSAANLQGTYHSGTHGYRLLVDVRFHMGATKRYRGPLPWDDDVDLAINGEGPFSQIAFEEFQALFTVRGLSVESRLWQSSLMVISEKGQSWPTLDLFVYYDYNGIMGRPGVESKLMPINYRLYHSFPSSLVQPPLPKVKFGFFNISIPRNGIEIMKHLYPYNWWKVVKPVGCEN